MYKDDILKKRKVFILKEKLCNYVFMYKLMYFKKRKENILDSIILCIFTNKNILMKERKEKFFSSIILCVIV